MGMRWPSLVFGLLAACNQATLNRIDPPLPVNANTYQACLGVPAPGCRTDDQACPTMGSSECVNLDPTPCAGGPCDVGAPRRVVDVRSDAGVR